MSNAAHAQKSKPRPRIKRCRLAKAPIILFFVWRERYKNKREHVRRRRSRWTMQRIVYIRPACSRMHVFSGWRYTEDDDAAQQQLVSRIRAGDRSERERDDRMDGWTWIFCCASRPRHRISSLNQSTTMSSSIRSIQMADRAYIYPDALRACVEEIHISGWPTEQRTDSDKEQRKHKQYAEQVSSKRAIRCSMLCVHVCHKTTTVTDQIVYYLFPANHSSTYPYLIWLSKGWFSRFQNWWSKE
jgi:hypothetical protein